MGFYQDDGGTLVDLVTTPHALNEQSAVGWDADNDQPFTWQLEGERSPVDPVDSSYALADFVLISTAGLVGATVDYGVYGRKAGTWTETGGLIELDNPGTAAFCRPADMSRGGDMVGYCFEDSESVERVAIRWVQGAEPEELTDWADGCTTEALAVNDGGVVLGIDSCGPSPWLWQDEQTVELAALVDDMGSWTDLSVSAISSDGHIAATVSDGTVSRPAVLIPAD